MTTVHRSSIGKPIVNGNQFLVEMKMDATQNAGPMAGVRMDMSEQCLYTVKNGKIAEAKFFYSMG
jgi:predicted ester cyclase